MRETACLSFRATGDAVVAQSGPLHWSAHATCSQIGAAGWRVHNGALHLKSDPLGLAPLYVARGAGINAVATSVLRAARMASSTRLDDDAMAVFLRFGSFIGNDTPLTDVKALPPGFEGPWDGRSDWVSMPSPPAFHGSYEDACARYNELFSKSISRLAKDAGSIHLPLSGGRDSRHILLALARQNLPIERVYTVASYVDEVSAARTLAERLNVKQEVASLDAVSMLCTRPVKNRQLDFLSRQHRVAYRLSDLMEGEQGTVFDGLGGDVLSNGLFFDADVNERIRSGAFENVANVLLGPEDRVDWLNPTLKARWNRDRAIAHFSAFIRQFQAAPNPLKEVYFWSRTRREISLAPLLLTPAPLKLAMPYVDEALTDFLRSLPAERFGQPGFHDAVIAKHYPRFSNVPYAAASQGPQWSALHRAHFYARAWGHMLSMGAAASRRGYVALRLIKATALLSDVDRLHAFDDAMFFDQMLHEVEG